MLKLAIALACACGGGSSPAPVNVATSKVQIRPLLVITGDGEADAAYLLACAKIEGGKAVVLDGKACAPLLDKVEVELVTESARVPVTLGAKSEENDCAAGEGGNLAAVVRIVGLPKEPAGNVIVGRGVAEQKGALAAPAMEAIRKARPLQPLKGPNEYGPHPVGQFDLDGDGVFEVLMSLGGMQYEVMTPAGKLIASVGCYVG